MRLELRIGPLHVEIGKPPAPKPPTPVGSAYPLGFHVTAKTARRNGRGYVTDPRIGGHHG